MTAVTAPLARFVVQTAGGDIPDAAYQVAQRAWLDTLGVALAGRRDEAGRIICDYVRDQGTRPAAQVWGAPVRVSAADAALANGTLAHALDYDDVNQSMRGHPSVPILPAVLAVAEEVGARGRAALAAFIVGVEVEAKLGRLIGTEHYHHGWHATATLGVLGAAAGVARLLGLDETQARSALGIAASHAAGLRQNFGTMTKPLHAGLAARAGVFAAQLAARGFTADESVIEAPIGYGHIFAAPGQPRYEGFVESLGQPWDLIDPGINVKAYPCCAATHRALDALFDLLADQPVAAEDVARVICRVPHGGAAPLIHHNPQTGLQGKFSMEYCLAAGLLDRQVTLDQFEDAAVQRPAAQDLLHRVDFATVEADTADGDGLVQGFADLTLQLRTGRELQRRVVIQRGTPQRPLSDEELLAKFRACAGRVLAPEAVEDAARQIRALPEAASVAPLVAALAGRVPVA